MKISKLSCPYCNKTLVSKTGSIESRAGSPFQRCHYCGKEFVNTHRYEPALYPFEKYIPTKGGLFFDRAGGVLMGSGLIVTITLLAAIFGGESWDLPGIFLIGALVLSSPFVILGLNDMSKGVTSEMYQKIVDDYLSSLTRLIIKDYALKLKAHGFEVPDRYFRDNPQAILDYSVREMAAYDKQRLSNYVELHKDHFPELSSLLEQSLNRCNTTQTKELNFYQNAPSQVQYDSRIAAKPSSEDQSRGNGNHMESNNNRLFCRKCGKELMLDSEFCSYCGTKIVRIDK